MNRVIIVGSPRSNGRSAQLAETLFEACIDECPEDELYLVPVGELEIGPCIGCNACREKMDVVFEEEDGSDAVEQRHRCVFDDDMQEVYGLLEDADELTVVSPVYFSGAPSSLKALLDRLQPFFWQWLEDREANGGASGEKRPAVLHVVGEGGDSNGYVPLVGEVRSALAVAGFKLERVYDWVGKIGAEGEIEDEAEVHELPALGTPLATLPLVAAAVDAAAVAGGDATQAAPANAAVDAGKNRPKLSLGSGAQKPSGAKKTTRQKTAGDDSRGSGRGNAGPKDKSSARGGASSRKGAAQGKGSQGKASQGKGAGRKGSGQGSRGNASGQGQRAGRNGGGKRRG